MYVHFFVASIIGLESNRLPHNRNQIVRCQEIPTPKKQCSIICINGLKVLFRLLLRVTE